MKKLPFKPQYSPPLDKIIFLIATTYLIIVCSWLFKQNQKVISSPTPANLSENTSAENLSPTPNISETSSPETISQPSEIPPLPNIPQTELITLTSPPEVSPLPIPTPPPLPKGIELPPPPLINVSANSNSPAKLASTEPSTPPIAQKIPSPPPPQTAKIARQFPPSLDTLPTLPNANPSPNTNNIPNTSTPDTGVKNNTLLGVIQLADQNNLALFNINSLTERVAEGAPIPATNWIVVSINKNEVVIRRQDQFQTLRVGEKF
ncbi:MAG: hypothetical protein IGQ45_03730 [Cyanobacterium sp. T60_A2020_053]|nr:hypothetical protein [Cyanobacterium sp. T60_A2020_053]